MGETRLTLPAVSDVDDYHRQFDSDAWLRAAALICARHRITHSSLRRSAQGESIIIYVDETYVVKIFAPFRETYARETAALNFVQGKLSIETPELRHTGEIEGWPYLLMTQLVGRASREVWAETRRADRFEIVSRLGVAMRELHAHRAPLQTALDRDWRGFIEWQARQSVERQRRCGAQPEWLESLPAYIAARLPLLQTNDRPVFLHGDIHAGNLLLAEEDGRWRVTGLIDFGDSLCGAKEYEFVAPGVLMVQGDAALQRALLLAYGYTEAQLDEELRARLMLLTILYECADLSKYALRLAPAATGLTLDGLERAIWTFTEKA